MVTVCAAETATPNYFRYTSAGRFQPDHTHHQSRSPSSPNFSGRYQPAWSGRTYSEAYDGSDNVRGLFFYPSQQFRAVDYTTNQFGDHQIRYEVMPQSAVQLATQSHLALHNRILNEQAHAYEMVYAENVSISKAFVCVYRVFLINLN